MEGKKGFILYADFIEMIEHLDMDKRGELLTVIFEYVNDKNPDIPKDMGVRMAFISIKQSLKRDLQKWKSIVERNRENGKKGGRPSKNPENPVGLSETQEETQKPKKPDIDIDNDTVKDTETEKVILNKYTTEQAKEIFEIAGLKGRYFSKMAEVHSLEEKIILEEFRKWSIFYNEDYFNSETHLKKSFNIWMMNYRPQKQKTPTKKTGSVFDEITENDLK